MVGVQRLAVRITRAAALASQVAARLVIVALGTQTLPVARLIGTTEIQRLDVIQFGGQSYNAAVLAGYAQRVQCKPSAASLLQLPAA